MTTSDLAIHQAQQCRDSVEPVKTLLGCAWIPLALLYDELAGQKEIDPIGSLPLEHKLKLWRLTEGSKFKRIYQSRALYIFDLLNADK